jgi:hypothetical protein
MRWNRKNICKILFEECRDSDLQEIMIDRIDKCADTFLSCIYFISMLIWLR